MRKARLVAPIPAERVDMAGGDGGSPQVGDVVELDQGFTFADGSPGGIVACIGADGSLRWTAEVHDAEIQVLDQARSHDG